MKHLTLLLVSWMLCLCLPAQEADGAAGASPIPLDVSIEKNFDYLMKQCTCQPPGENFWKNPKDGGVGTDQNGWQGAQALQSILINYEATHDEKYLKVIQDFANWVLQVYPTPESRTLCQTWPDYDLDKDQGVGKSPSHFSNWNDDAGWVMVLYLQFYQYTQRTSFLNDAYQTLLNGDKQWGVDFQDNSRGLRYKDHQDHYPIYMAVQLVAALGISDALRKAGDQDRAATAFALACRYDNFIENYLHSTGRGQPNITGNKFGMAPDCYEIATSFGTGPKTPSPDAKCSKLNNSFFTTPHMMMAAAYLLLEEAEKNGADVRLIDPKFHNFHERAIKAANAFTTPYPDGYLENAASGRGTVFIDACDPNVNGFGCYWWAKYVVPLDPDRYGKVVIRTAQEIIANQGTGDLSASLWNSPRGQTSPHSSHSVYADAGYWVMCRDASSCAIVSAANWIQKTYNFGL